mgnify:CR=1 FL=1
MAGFIYYNGMKSKDSCEKRTEIFTPGILTRNHPYICPETLTSAE